MGVYPPVPHFLLRSRSPSPLPVYTFYAGQFSRYSVEKRSKLLNKMVDYGNITFHTEMKTALIADQVLLEWSCLFCVVLFAFVCRYFFNNRKLWNSKLNQPLHFMFPLTISAGVSGVRQLLSVRWVQKFTFVACDSRNLSISFAFICLKLRRLLS